MRRFRTKKLKHVWFGEAWKSKVDKCQHLAKYYDFSSRNIRSKTKKIELKTGLFFVAHNSGSWSLDVLVNFPKYTSFSKIVLLTEEISLLSSLQPSQGPSLFCLAKGMRISLKRVKLKKKKKITLSLFDRSGGSSLSWNHFQAPVPGIPSHRFKNYGYLFICCKE